MKLKVGDKVKLNSGGPMMTVTKLGLFDDSARCAWFNDCNVCEEADFPSRALSCFSVPSGPIVVGLTLTTEGIKASP